jgi:hypothetical protein
MTRIPRFPLEAIMALLAFLICFAIVIGLTTWPALPGNRRLAHPAIEKPLHLHPTFGSEVNLSLFLKKETI